MIWVNATCVNNIIDIKNNNFKLFGRVFCHNENVNATFKQDNNIMLTKYKTNILTNKTITSFIMNKLHKIKNTWQLALTFMKNTLKSSSWLCCLNASGLIQFTYPTAITKTWIFCYFSWKTEFTKNIWILEMGVWNQHSSVCVTDSKPYSYLYKYTDTHIKCRLARTLTSVQCALNMYKVCYIYVEYLRHRPPCWLRWNEK